jgi:hypothetical protein
MPEEVFEDKVLICKDTGKEFVFTAGEQEFYKKKGFPDPVRSPEARKARKLQKEQREQEKSNESGGRYVGKNYHA